MLTKDETPVVMTLSAKHTFSIIHRFAEISEPSPRNIFNRNENGSVPQNEIKHITKALFLRRRKEEEKITYSQ